MSGNWAKAALGGASTRRPVGCGAVTRTFASKLAARAVGARRTAQARRTVNARMGAASEPLQDKVCGTPLGFGPYTVRRLGWPGPGWGRRGQGTGIAGGGGGGLGWGGG